MTQLAPAVQLYKLVWQHAAGCSPCCHAQVTQWQRQPHASCDNHMHHAKITRIMRHATNTTIQITSSDACNQRYLQGRGIMSDILRSPGCISMVLQPGPNGPAIQLNPDGIFPLFGSSHACITRAVQAIKGDCIEQLVR